MENVRVGKAFSLILMSSLLGVSLPWQKRPPAEIPDDVRINLITYLKAHWMTPEDYVVSKFKDYDIVLIGEHHLIKQDVEFIQSLIPTLYRNGITSLGIEFGCYELQKQVDSLLTAETYDEGLARQLLFQWGSYWPYVEYLDLYKKAWEFNKSLPRDAPKFRIVNLDYRPRWNLLRKNMPRQRWKAVFFRGPRDEHMARVIIDEFIKKRKKALVYSGQHHAFTRFSPPEYDSKKQELVRLNEQPMGNLVYRRVPKKVFNICLHYPWTTIRDPQTYDYPLGGAIDRIMKEFETKRVGFDVVGSPFGRLGDKDAVYSAGRKNFVLSDFCDGYIFQRPFSEYEGCTVDPLFITKENLAEAIAYLPNADVKKKIKTVAQFLHKMKWDADFKRLYPELE